MMDRPTLAKWVATENEHAQRRLDRPAHTELQGPEIALDPIDGFFVGHGNAHAAFSFPVAIAVNYATKITHAIGMRKRSRLFRANTVEGLSWPNLPRSAPVHAARRTAANQPWMIHGAHKIRRRRDESHRWHGALSDGQNRIGDEMTTRTATPHGPLREGQ